MMRWQDPARASPPRAGKRLYIRENAVAFDALSALREAGSPVDLLSDEQRTVLGELSEAEVAVLVSVQERLRAVSDADVEGHGGIKVC
jgi:hypothetical protein